jgi:hypothetical protein
MNQTIKTVTKRLAIGCLVAAATGFAAFAQTSKTGQFKIHTALNPIEHDCQ